MCTRTVDRLTRGLEPRRTPTPSGPGESESPRDTAEDARPCRHRGRRAALHSGASSGSGRATESAAKLEHCATGSPAGGSQTLRCRSWRSLALSQDELRRDSSRRWACGSRPTSSGCLARVLLLTDLSITRQETSPASRDQGQLCIAEPLRTAESLPQSRIYGKYLDSGQGLASPRSYARFTPSVAQRR